MSPAARDRAATGGNRVFTQSARIMPRPFGPGAPPGRAEPKAFPAVNLRMTQYISHSNGRGARGWW